LKLCDEKTMSDMLLCGYFIVSVFTNMVMFTLKYYEYE